MQKLIFAERKGSMQDLFHQIFTSIIIFFHGDGVKIIVSILSIFAGWILYRILAAALTRWGRRQSYSYRGRKIHIDYLYSPMRILIPMLCFYPVFVILHMSEKIRSPISHLMALVLIGVLAWLMIRFLSVLRELVLSRYQIEAKDNLKARQVYTQIHVIERILIVIILVLALSMILMTFERVRQLGMSLLASAGVMGIIIGFAAQRSIATLFAGIQIAITQPIRIDDVVIVEGEWGWIEEITLTFVVVKIWDMRRLVVPITYFIDHPFQNWTRNNAAILGTVYLYTDYTIDVDSLREAFTSQIQESKHWDGEVANLQITNTTEKTIEIRALMSAVDSPTAWDLRCEIREKMIDYMQRHHSESLPKVRIETEKKINSPHE